MGRWGKMAYTLRGRGGGRQRKDGYIIVHSIFLTKNHSFVYKILLKCKEFGILTNDWKDHTFFINEKLTFVNCIKAKMRKKFIVLTLEYHRPIKRRIKGGGNKGVIYEGRGGG